MYYKYLNSQVLNNKETTTIPTQSKVPRTILKFKSFLDFLCGSFYVCMKIFLKFQSYYNQQ